MKTLNKIKTIVLSAVALVTISAFELTVSAETIVSRQEVETVKEYTCKYIDKNYSDNVLTDGLKSNQTTLFYMYSNDTGHYFLDPKSEFENVIYVGLNDYLVDSNFTIDTTTLHHGKKFIGTFVDDSLWELISIKENK